MNCDIIVHLDGGPRTAVRLDVAADIAAKHGGRLVGLFGQTESSPGILASRDRKGDLPAAAARVREAFDEKVRAAGLKAHWRDVSGRDQDRLISEVISASHLADLIVMGQYSREESAGTLPEALNEQVILNAGRPVLLIPSVGDYGHLGRHIVIAWNGSREAARALADSLPLLRAAESVRVLGLHTAGRPSHAGEEQVVEHLACHGVSATSESLGIENIGVMDAILSRSADLGGDLLVMGAHGHYGFPSMHRGSGTRYVLRHMPLPVMMSH